MSGWFSIILIVIAGGAAFHFLFSAIVAYDEVGKAIWKDSKYLSQRFRSARRVVVLLFGGFALLGRFVLPEWRESLEAMAGLMFLLAGSSEIVWAIGYWWIVKDKHPLMLQYAKRICWATLSFALMLFLPRVIF